MDKDPRPFWFWLAILLAWTTLIGLSHFVYMHWMQQQRQENAFLQVSNRQMSLFLWQFPEYMRANVKQKNGYLPAFRYLDKIGLDPLQADNMVEAPPELLFLYHTWQRLLGDYFFAVPIERREFIEFLNSAEEWQPKYWKKAPQGYIDLVQNIEIMKQETLTELPLEVLPVEVRKAFQGWKNFHKEGVEINAMQITYEGMAQFLQEYPHYRRNYWQNILNEKLPKYLSSVDEKDVSGIIPADEISGFLRVAYFNYHKVIGTREPLTRPQT